MVEYLYAKRMEYGSEGEGAPFKLALNSMYGKFAQRRTGSGPYWDAVAAGLERIVVALPPRVDEWLAVHDRLLRAAASRI